MILNFTIIQRNIIFSYHCLDLLLQKTILSLIHPVAPHLASECLLELDSKNKLEWPNVDQKKILNDNINIVVQINGKKRGIINLTNEVSESELIIKIKNNPLINKFINNEELKKTIYIKNKLIKHKGIFINIDC